MNDSVLIAVAVGALGIAAISMPYVAARSSENGRARREQYDADVRAEARRIVSDAIRNGRWADLSAVPEIVQSAWEAHLAKGGGRGAGGLGPRYAEAAFKRTATEYVLSYLLAHGVQPSGGHSLKGEWVGSVHFPGGSR